MGRATGDRRPWYAGAVLLAVLVVVELGAAAPASTGERGEIIETVGLTTMLMAPIAVVGGVIGGFLERRGPIARALVWLIAALLACMGAVVAGLVVFWSGDLLCGFEGAEACGTSSPERLAGSVVVSGCFVLAACIASRVGASTHGEDECRAR